jgi:molybdate transport system ATP-binding protein
VSVEVAVEHRFEQFHLSVSMAAGSGLTALVGPSGAGKTSVLNIIAGVVRPDRGVVRLDGEVLVDTAKGIWRPPHRRRIGYVFQTPRLFSHLSVRRNLMFGSWFAGEPPARLALDEVVELLDLGALLARMPAKLSGGEAQRVALGRALLSQPRLLLLDEPLVSVDQARRDEVLPYLDRLRTEIRMPAIYVTHTPADLESRAEQVIAMDRGRVIA